MRAIISILFIFLFITTFSQETRVKPLVYTKKQKRFDKRFVHPKSKFVKVGGGFFSSFSQMTDETPVFKNKTFLSPEAKYLIEIESGMSNNFFYEYGVSIVEYGFGNRYKSNNSVQKHEFFYDVFQIFGGFGKRFILKNSNLNLFDFQAGFSLSMKIRPNEEAITNYSRNNYVKTREHNEYIINEFKPNNKNILFPMLYFSISKNIRINNDISIFFDYGYDYGFITIFDQSISVTNRNSNFESNTVNFLNGSGQSLSFGLVVNINNPKQ